ncbi:MAG: phage head morphogenesis protein, partial [Rhodospirillales bacterium CG15_BIG_FIL_POST_REV_8_21_14_020_66_15]
RGIDLGFDYNVGKARLRAFTPPPLGGLPQSFPPGVGLPDLPRPRAAAAGDIMPDGLKDQEYIDQFLKPFGARHGGPGVIFTDKAGEDLVISDDLFREAGGALKIGKSRNRRAYVKLLARAVKEPDEIWWIWEQVKDRPGTWTLRRRYIARFEIEGSQAPGLAVFEHGQDGWTGVTAFEPQSNRSAQSQDRYLQGQRAGTLAYRR